MKKKFAVIVMMLLVLFGCSENDPQNTVMRYFEYYRQKNPEGLRALQITDTFGRNDAYGFDAIKSIQVIDLTPITENENDAVIGVNFDVQYLNNAFFIFSEGRNYTTFTLKKIEGEWKIIAIGNNV